MFELASSHRFLFKPDNDVQDGGCHMDVWLPLTRDKAGLPVAIAFHGGAWTMGTTQSVPQNQVQYLLAKGLVVVSCEYRLLPHVSFKEMREDFVDAYRFVQGHLEQAIGDAGTTGVSINGERTCALGWSAGGGAALWLGADITAHNKTDRLKLPPLRAVIVSYALIDLNDRDPLEPQSVFLAMLDRNENLNKARDKLMSEKTSVSVTPPKGERSSKVFTSRGISRGTGGRIPGIEPPIDLPPRLIWLHAMLSSGTEGSFLTRKDPPFLPEDSPIGHITADYPPTHIVVATADAVIPTSQSYRLHRVLQERGVDCGLTEVEGMEHGEAEHAWEEGCDWWEKYIKPSLDWTIARV